jgi:hypothetical protein
MRPKATIRKRADGKWVATRPAFGFAPSEAKPCGSQREALAWLEGCAGRGGYARDDRAEQDHDGVSAVPAWSTLERVD